ncbi:MAG: hypothetical protein ACU843_12155 [Gammaproteobacteria bacterium]
MKIANILRSNLVFGIGLVTVLPLINGSGVVSAAGFPTAACRPGFIQAGPRLCIDQFVQAATNFDEAMNRCRNRRAYVASYGDLYYLYRNTALDPSYNPSGRWIGPDLVGDDTALCGNRAITINGDGDQENFEGQCHKNDNRTYWCAHDDE